MNSGTKPNILVICGPFPTGQGPVGAPCLTLLGRSESALRQGL